VPIFQIQIRYKNTLLSGCAHLPEVTLAGHILECASPSPFRTLGGSEYNNLVVSQQNPRITIGRASSLAFALLVLASYFAMFSSTAQKSISLMGLGLVMFLGVAYIAIGIYGYNFASDNPDPLMHLIYFLIQIPLGAAIVYLSGGAGFNALILLPLVGHSVILLSRRGELVTNGAISLAYIIAVRLYSPNWDAVFSGVPTFLAGVVFILVFTQMAISEQRARSEVEHLVDELGAANQRLREFAIQAEDFATIKERNRLAREIHDGLGHYLTAIHMQIQAARAVLGPTTPQADQALATAQKLAQEALVDVRQSVAALRASAEENRPLDQSITQLIEDCLKDQVKTHFEVSGSPRTLSPQTHLTLFRAAQEAINNVSKHANATDVSIALNYTVDGQVKLFIRDNGLGTDHFDGGFGLLGLQERANLLGGTIDIVSAVGQGFSLELVVPG
jgi:signal transduction histidine kinase